MSSKIKKTLYISLAVVAFVAAATVLSFLNAASSAKEAADEMRQEIKEDFVKNMSRYEDMVDILTAGMTEPEYCIILQGDTPMLNINYESKPVTDEMLTAELKNFADFTKVQVIYVDAEAVYFKREFKSGLSAVSEANMILRFDGEAPSYEGCQKINGDWYYAEIKTE